MTIKILEHWAELGLIGMTAEKAVMHDSSSFQIGVVPFGGWLHTNEMLTLVNPHVVSLDIVQGINRRFEDVP